MLMRVALSAHEGGTQKLPENQLTEAIRGHPRPSETIRGSSAYRPDDPIVPVEITTLAAELHGGHRL